MMVGWKVDRRAAATVDLRVVPLELKASVWAVLWDAQWVELMVGQ